MYSIIQKEAKHSFIARVDGIKRCFLNQSKLPSDNGCFKLTTEGINVNVCAFLKLFFAPCKLYTIFVSIMEDFY